MSNLDKEFNKRFQYKKSTSDDAEMENLWAAVEEELNEEKSTRGFFYYFRWLGMLSLVLLIGGVSYWMGSTSKQEIGVNHDLMQREVVRNEATKSSVQLDHAPIELSTEDKLEKNVKEENVQKKNVQEKDVEEENNLLNTLNTETKRNREIQQKNKKNEIKDFDQIDINLKKEAITPVAEKSSINQVTKEISFGETGIKRAQEAVDLKLDNSVNVEKMLAESKDNFLSPIQFLVARKFLIEDQEVSLPTIKLLPLEPFSPKNKESDEEKKQKNIAFFLGVNGGVNWSSQQYENAENPTFEDLRNSTEKGEVGQSYGVEVGLTFKNRWIIQSGLEYHKRWSKFEYTSTQIGSIIKEDVATTIWVDGMDTLSVAYGDVSVNRTTVREVVHYNQSKSISIPLEFGFKNRTGKLTYGITMGTSFNFLLNQSGKLLDEFTGISEYDKDSEIAPLNNFSLGIRISPFLGYHLSEKIVLGLKPNMMWQQHDVNLRQLAMRVGLQVEF